MPLHENEYSPQIAGVHGKPQPESGAPSNTHRSGTSTDRPNAGTVSLNTRRLALRAKLVVLSTEKYIKGRHRAITAGDILLQFELISIA